MATPKKPMQTALPKKMATKPMQKVTAKPVDSFKKDSTSFSKMSDSLGTGIKRQIRSGNEMSMDSARASIKKLEGELNKLKAKYPGKKLF
jgi:hypothetical protein